MGDLESAFGRFRLGDLVPAAANRPARITRAELRARLPKAPVDGESHQVLVLYAEPIGDSTLITCQDPDDPQVPWQFTTPGLVEVGTRGRITFQDHFRAYWRGWRFTREGGA